MLMRTVYSKRIAALAIVVAFLLSSLPLAALGQTKPGVDTTGMDRSVDPGDDFFLYANGGWYNKTEIPADRTSLGVFQGIAAEVARRNAGLITDAAKQNTPEAKMVTDYYNAYMDEARIESLGIKPIEPELAQIAAIKNIASLSSVLGSELRSDVDPLNSTNFYTDRVFGMWVSADLNNPSRNVPYLLQGGLTMPDRDFYMGTDADSKAIQAKFKTHIA